MMYNPLFSDFKKLKDQEIENRILDLNKKYWIAARMGQGSAADQIIMALENLKEEQARRRDEAFKKASKSNNGDLDELINVD